MEAKCRGAMSRRMSHDRRPRLFLPRKNAMNTRSRSISEPTAGDLAEERGGQSVLSVRDLIVEFESESGTVHAVNGLSYELAAGEILAIVGESGSGKSVAAKAVMGILESPPAYVAGGQIVLNGQDLSLLSASARRKLCGPQIAMVFQEAPLNPAFTVGFQLAEIFRVHLGMSKREARRRSIELLDRVRIPSPAARIDDYPHQFSGGMRQRVVIAMAIALDPYVLMADEPTTALDVTVQSQIMDLLGEIRDESGMGMVLITHDLGVIAETADRAAVMYAGRVVELSTVESLFKAPAHPYTLGLMKSVPQAAMKGRDLHTIEGSPPLLHDLPRGCPFHPRCDFVVDKCRSIDPPLVAHASGRFSACHRVGDVLDEER